MPEFTEFQLNARKLSERISGLLKKSSKSALGCMTFFQPLSIDAEGVNDVQTISLVAESLDEKNDLPLRYYLQEPKAHSVLSSQEFKDFKTKALTGCYIVKWRKYNSESSFNNKSLLDFFRKDLNVKGLGDLEADYIDSCLVAFSDFCGFVFKNKASSTYSGLNEQLKGSIQLEIHNARFPTTTASSLLYEAVNTGMQALGIKF
ncbi:hypothetical protein [Legionella sp. km772]|uniref:hypothetical protein n=1 Tax=Legionella sp. km772 TaxID=2498111 RepID=UPI000F8DEB00|nr:hypothetical protein [Legionella sp. km772]RUR12374.1 hypothetical protein ELY15_05320 [Legionella sp. km772]